MAEFEPAVSGNIATAPALAYDSDNGTDEITLDLTAIPANAEGCYIMHVPGSYESGPMIPVAWRSATGTFTVSGLTPGVHYFVAIPFEDDGAIGPVSNRVRKFLGAVQGLDTLLEHLETQLRNMIWTTNPVFGVVHITDLEPDEIAAQYAQKPIALITVEGIRQSPVGGGMNPGLVRASIHVHIYQRHASMDRGRAILMGGNIPDADGSAGKGILELRRKVRSELAVMTTAQGTRYVYMDTFTDKVSESGKQGFVSKTTIEYNAEVYDAEA